MKVRTPFKIPAEGEDIYVHFVLPLEFKKERYIRAVQVRPSNRAVAHHGVPILDGSGTARRLAKKHGGEHYPNFGGPGFLPRGFLPGYAPGMMTRRTPADTPFAVGPGIDLVLQMHYHPIGREQSDQPEVGLYFTDKAPTKGIVGIPLGSEEIDIPAGEKAFRRSDSFKLPADIEVRDIFPHMHMIGKDVKVWAETPAGKTVRLLHIADWDFNWQDSYRYKKPILLPRGTIVKAEFTWDNTNDHPRNPNNPPKRIRHGEGSADEMAGIWIGGVTAKSRWDEIPMWAAAIGHFLDVSAKGRAFKSKMK